MEGKAMKYFLLLLLLFMLFSPVPVTDYAVPGHCYMQLDSSFVAIGDSIQTRYRCFIYPSDKHVCLLPSIDNGYQDSPYADNWPCANLDRRATDQEMKDLIFADECVVGRTFVPCLEESINAVR
jgi:hypothetical protein